MKSNRKLFDTLSVLFLRLTQNLGIKGKTSKLLKKSFDTFRVLFLRLTQNLGIKGKTSKLLKKSFPL